MSEIGLCLADSGCHKKDMKTVGGVLTATSALDLDFLRARLAAAKHETGESLLSYVVTVGGGKGENSEL